MFAICEMYTAVYAELYFLFCLRNGPRHIVPVFLSYGGPPPPPGSNPPLRRFTPSWTSTRVTCDCLLPFVHPLLSQVIKDFDYIYIYVFHVCLFIFQCCLLFNDYFVDVHLCSETLCPGPTHQQQGRSNGSYIYICRERETEIDYSIFIS